MEEMQNQPVPEPGKTYSSKNNSFTILSLCFGMIAIATCSMFFIALPAGDLQSRHHHFGNRDLPVFPHHGSSILSGVLQSGLQAAAQ